MPPTPARRNLRPTEGMASYRSTCTPAWARTSAAISPAGPPPITATEQGGRGVDAVMGRSGAERGRTPSLWSVGSFQGLQPQRIKALLVSGIGNISGIRSEGGGSENEAHQYAEKHVEQAAVLDVAVFRQPGCLVSAEEHDG